MDFHNLVILANGGGKMKEKFNKLMEKNGFILLLFLLVCLVAGGTLYLSMKSLNGGYQMGKDDFVIIDENSANQANEETDLEETITTDNQIEELEGEALAEADLALEDEELEEVLDEELEEVIETSSRNLEDEIEFEDDIEDLEELNLVSTQKNSIILPVDGPIITEYTSNSLVYSETLEAWVGHGAIDIEAELGTPVKAALDGVVKEVYEDDLWGIVIVIDHGNQLETKYANLMTKEMVKEGGKVKQGDHISKVGNTAKIEMLMKPHLHFEVRKDGKLVDPRSITR